MTTRMRGALPTPRYRLAAATPFLLPFAALVPPQWIWLPRALSYWGNNVDGCCVTTEEAFNKACSGILISDRVCHDWASQHNVLNGAYLDQVLDWMTQRGFSQDGNVYNDGAKTAINYHDDNSVRAAISQSPVKIGVAATQLENVVGNRNGWLGVNFQADQNLDHCISLCGYGPLGWLAQQLAVSIPSGVNANAPGYAAFTWDTVGILDVPSMLAITGEAWARSPATVIQGTNPPTPDVVFTPTPVPPGPPPPPPPSPSAATITLNQAVRAGQSVRFNAAKPAGVYVRQQATADEEAAAD